MNKLVYLSLSILAIIKTLFYEFKYGYIKPKHHYNVKLQYRTWIQIALSCALKLTTSMKVLQIMLKKGSTHQIM